MPRSKKPRRLAVYTPPPAPAPLLPPIPAVPPNVFNPRQELLQQAAILAHNSHKPVHLVRGPNKALLLTQIAPHCAEWRKLKYEHLETVKAPDPMDTGSSTSNRRWRER